MHHVALSDGEYAKVADVLKWSIDGALSSNVVSDVRIIPLWIVSTISSVFSSPIRVMPIFSETALRTVGIELLGSLYCMWEPNCRTHSLLLFSQREPLLASCPIDTQLPREGLLFRLFWKKMGRRGSQEWESCLIRSLSLTSSSRRDGGKTFSTSTERLRDDRANRTVQLKHTCETAQNASATFGEPGGSQENSRAKENLIDASIFSEKFSQSRHRRGRTLHLAAHE